MEATQAHESTLNSEPQKEHHWLQQLVGTWTYETEALMGPDSPAEKATGTETVRSIGSLWIVAEGQGQMPGGDDATTMMTLGYDPQQQCYLGTWVGSIMTHLWVYEGEMDADQKVLTLNTTGPAMMGDGIAQYRDVIELENDDRRSLAAYVLQDGEWHKFMTTTYQRQQ